MSDPLAEWDFSRGSRKKPQNEDAKNGVGLSEIHIQGMNEPPEDKSAAQPIEASAKPLPLQTVGKPMEVMSSKTGRTGRQLWAVARAAMLDGRIHNAARKARVQTRPKKVELDSDGNIKTKQQEGTQTADTSDISTLSPVTCLLHDVCSTTNFAYAEIWFRPPLAGDDMDSSVGAIQNQQPPKAGPMGSQGSLLNLHGDNTMGKKGGVSRRISQAIQGKNNSNPSLPAGRTSEDSTHSPGDPKKGRRYSGNLSLGSLPHFPKFGGGHANANGNDPAHHARPSGDRSVASPEERLMSKLRWSGMSYAHAEFFQKAVSEGRCDENWSRKIKNLELLSQDSLCWYEEGQGLPGLAWKARKLSWHDLAGLKQDDDMMTDMRVSTAKSLFDVSVGVPILDPNYGYIFGVLMLYRIGNKPGRRPNQNWKEIAKKDAIVNLIQQGGKAAYWSMHLQEALESWGKLRQASEDKETRLELTVSSAKTADVTHDGEGDKGLIERFSHFFWKYIKKFRGQKATPPGPHTWQFSLWSFFGTYVGVFIITSINNRIREIDYRDHYIFILINSMGAVAGMLFSAPTSPLVQPRNVFGGHLIASVTAVAMDYLGPEHLNLLDQWIIAPIAPAIAIFIMSKVGLIHPPACACAVIYMMGLPEIKNVGWLYIICPTLFDCFLLITAAVLINNLSKDRSYPLYW